MNDGMQGKIQVALPKWRSHKVVYGDKITEIRHGAADVNSEFTGDSWLLECSALIPETNSLVARGAPSVGDYYVQYEDGYQSWSPAKAFEEGYTRV